MLTWYIFMVNLW